MADITIKTPSQFVEEETENLKLHLDNHDIQINKLGFAGFFINLLGHIRYDAFQYYQNLFKESFVALSEDENNLYMHSSIYGYTTSYAVPASAEGSITFDFSYLPKDNSQSKRVVTLKNVTFNYDGIPFTTNTVYKFVEEGTNYYVIVYTTDGKVNYVPSSTCRITVPFFNVEQKTTKKESFVLPNYQFGSYYPYKMDIDNYLSDLQIYVKQPSKEYDANSEGDLFEVKKIKYSENQYSKSCFFKEITSQSFILEFGSGLRGVYIPDSEITIYKSLTYGKDGCVTNSKTLPLDSVSTTTLSSIDDQNNETISDRTVSYRFFNINFDYSDYGYNPPTGNELRQDILKFIQSRDFLIDQKDYYNLTDIYEGDFVYSFRKSHIFRNDFYLHQTIRDEYQVPIKSTCLNIPKLNTNLGINGFTINAINETDGNLSGTVEYTIFATDKFHISQQITSIQDIILPNNAFELSWDEFTNAQNYVIIVNDEYGYRYFTTTSNYFVDVGQDSDYTNTFIYSHTDSDGPLISWKDSYIFFPEVIYNSVEFVSPFVYKYNKNFNWFEGYVFYDDFIVLFSNTNVDLNKETNYTLPYFHLRVNYDNDNMMTVIEAISSQAIEDYTMRFTVSGTDIHNQEGTMINENSFAVVYDDDTYGILDGERTVEIQLFYTVDTVETYDNQPVLAQFTTNEFHQIKCVKDQLKLLQYIDEKNDEYVLSIPLIEKTYYENNREETDLIILNSIYQSNIEGRRFPGDEVQFRFLNTYMIDSQTLRNSVIQKYDYDLFLPLKLIIGVTFDTTYVTNNDVDLAEEKQTLLLSIAQKLQDSYSGNQIKYYNSQLVDFVHTNRPFIKSVTVEITDFNDTVIDHGLESYTELNIMDNLQNDVIENFGNKMQILDYFPHYWFWDLDNIVINYSF